MNQKIQEALNNLVHVIYQQIQSEAAHALLASLGEAGAGKPGWNVSATQWQRRTWPRRSRSCSGIAKLEKDVKRLEHA